MDHAPPHLGLHLDAGPDILPVKPSTRAWGPYPGQYQHLYAKQNGWKSPRFLTHEISVQSSFISSMHTFSAVALSWDGRGDLIALGTSDGVEVCFTPQTPGCLLWQAYTWVSFSQITDWAQVLDL